MDWTHGSRDQFTVQGDIYAQKDGEQVNLSTYTPPTNINPDGYAALSV